MGKSTPSPPPAPDPSNLVNQQTASNAYTAIANARMNHVNQVTPYGTLTYYENGPWQDIGNGTYVPSYTAETKLSPTGQKLFDTQSQISQGTADLANQYVKRIADATSQPYSYDNLPAAPTYNLDYVNKATNDIIARNQPQMDRDRANLEQRLANQGISVGTPAYQAAMDQYQRGVNDFRLGAQTQGQAAATNEFNLEGSTRDRAIQEMTNLRTQPINEVAALLGTGTGVQNPQFVNTPQTNIAPTDVAGIYQNGYQQQMQAYQLQQQQAQQQQNAMLGGLFGLGSSLAGGWALGGFKSDIRTKENIHRIGTARNGLGLYLFNYIGDPTPQFGLMAQEVEKVRPEAVFEIDGVKHVNYVKALADA